MNNKRVIFYFISLLILMSLFAVFVLSAGSTQTNGLYRVVVSNITDARSATTALRLNITTGEQLNVTCSAERSWNGTSIVSLENAISNLSLYHNLNLTGANRFIALNITNTTNNTNSITILQQNSTLSGLSARFRVQNGTITYDSNGAWSGRSTLNDGNHTIACAAAVNETSTFNYSANITITIDRIPPNFSLLNITDGTKTVLQANLNGTSTATANSYFTNNTNLTLRVTLTEPYVDSIRVYWTINNTPVSLNDFRTSLNPRNLTLNNVVVNDDNDRNISVWNGSFLVGGGSDEGIVALSLLVDGATVNFMLVANDSAGNIKNFSNGGAGFNFTIDGKTPNFNLSSNSLFNVTDGSTVLELDKLNGTLQVSPVYLKNDSSLNLKVTITEPNVDNVRLFWSANGTPVTLNEYSTRNNPRNLTLNKIVTQTGTNGNNSVWNGSFLFGGNGSTAFTYQDSVVINFMLVANDSAGNIKNLSNNGAGFNFTLDGLAPDISSFTLDKTRIATLNSIKATCTTNDTSTVSYKITLTKPNSGKVEKNPLDGKATFTSLNTGEAGKYTVTCEIEDAVKLKTTKTLEFTAFYEGEDFVISEVEEAEKVAEVDLSKAVAGQAPEAIVSGLQGESTTFTLDGETGHSLTFLEVTASSATLRFESSPVDVTLNIGQTREVDLDGDSNNDVVVTLDSIVDEEAKVKIKPVRIPERKEEKPLKEKAPQPTEKPSRAGAIIVILLILAVVVAAHFLLKGKDLIKRKKHNK